MPPPARVPIPTAGRPSRDPSVLAESRAEARIDPVAILAHDLRSPLANAREFLAIVLDGIAGPLRGSQVENLTIAARNLEAAIEMTSRLLDLKRIELGGIPLRRGRIPLAPLLERMARLSFEGVDSERAILSIDLVPGTPDVFADPDRLLQAIRNLVDNAVRHARGAVRIWVEARPAADGRVEIRVRDSGTGLPLQIERALSDRGPGRRSLLQGRGTGQGLGLAIVRSIVDLHGGRLRVSSRQGAGTTFTITLPAYEPRGIATVLLEEIWETAHARGRGVGFVRMRWAALRGGPHETTAARAARLREAAREILGATGRLLPPCDGCREVCMVLPAAHACIDRLSRRLRRSLSIRLRQRAGIEIVWRGGDSWVHSRTFKDADEMAEVILESCNHPGGAFDGSEAGARRR